MQSFSWVKLLLHPPSEIDESLAMYAEIYGESNDVYKLSLQKFSCSGAKFYIEDVFRNILEIFVFMNLALDKIAKINLILIAFLEFNEAVDTYIAR